MAFYPMEIPLSTLFVNLFSKILFLFFIQPMIWIKPLEAAYLRA